MTDVERVVVGDLVLDHVPGRGATSRPPVLFVHGLWAGAWLWERWLPVAADRGLDAWAVELRGRNGSRPVPDLGRVRIDGFVRDVRDALDRIGPAVLIGHSMGGLVAQAAAATDPNVLAAAFLCRRAGSSPSPARSCGRPARTCRRWCGAAPSRHAAPTPTRSS